MLHCAMRLPATRKTAAEEDRGEDNKDPDWLIEQSIVRQVAGGVCYTWTFFVQLTSQQHCETCCETTLPSVTAPLVHSHFVTL